MFDIVRILWAHTDIFRWRYLLLLLLSAISYSVLLSTVNETVEAIYRDQREFHLLLVFGVAYLLLFVTTQLYLTHAIDAIETLVRVRRNELFELVRGSDLRMIERFSKNAIYSRIALDTQVLSTNLVQMVEMLMFSVRSLSVMVYMFTVSLLGGLLIVFGLMLYSLIYRRIDEAVVRYMRQADEKIQTLLSLVEQLSHGFSELRVNHRKARDLREEFGQVASESSHVKKKAGMIYATSFLGNQAMLFAIIGAVIFVYPHVSGAETVMVSHLVAATLFLFTPIDVVVAYFPTISATRTAFVNIEELRLKLRACQRIENRVNAFETSRFRDFQELRLRDVVFAFRDQDQQTTFVFGPCDTRIKRGELIFVVGGNGAGKSIFLKLLSGLYYPEDGGIFVDGQPISGSLYEEYRDLFAIIFTDFHLFHRLLDFRPEAGGQVATLIEDMQLGHKTALDGDRFFTTDLSTGQRKRLAYVVARLEDRPIHLFDEFAADQDPLFKHFFYEQVLARLKRDGKTVICVSHDEHYFHLADRILVLDRGQVSEMGAFDGDLGKLMEMFRRGTE
jgi:putative pyoverdin transport system ATP-binding/permease protein